MTKEQGKSMSSDKYQVEPELKVASEKKRNNLGPNIMVVTFNEELTNNMDSQQREENSLIIKHKKAPYGTIAFHESSKRRLERIQKINDEMKLKEKTFAESNLPESRSMLIGRNFITSQMSKGSNFNLSSKKNSFDPLSPLNSFQITGSPQSR